MCKTVEHSSAIVHQRSPQNVYSQPFHFWLCADLYSAPTRRLRNLMSEVLFQFESEHSDRGIMYFAIDPPFGTNPPVYRRSHLFGRRRAFIFSAGARCSDVYPRAAISSLFVLRRNRIVRLCIIELSTPSPPHLMLPRCVYMVYICISHVYTIIILRPYRWDFSNLIFWRVII